MSMGKLLTTFNNRGASIGASLGVLVLALWVVGAVTSPNSLVLSGHRDAVDAVAFSPDGKLASGGSDCTLIIWDAWTGKTLVSLDPPEGRYPDNNKDEGTIYDSIEGIGAPFIKSLSFSKDGKTLAVGASDESIRLWDIEGKKQRLKIKLDYSGPFKRGNPAYGVAFAPDGKSLASASFDKMVRLWSSETGKLIREFRGHEDFVYTVAFAADGKSLASGSADKTVRVWAVEGGEAKMVLKTEGRVWSVAISADGRCLAAGVEKDDEKSQVFLWDFATGKKLANLEGQGILVRGVAFSPDSSVLASGDNYNVILRDVAKRERLIKLGGHKSVVTSVAFSPDGKQLASGSSDKTVRVWNVEKFLKKR